MTPSIPRQPPNGSIFGHTGFRIGPSEAKNDQEADFDVKTPPAPQKPGKNCEIWCSRHQFFGMFFFCVFLCFWRFWGRHGSQEAEILTVDRSRRPGIFFLLPARRKNCESSVGSSADRPRIRRGVILSPGRSDQDPHYSEKYCETPLTPTHDFM